MRVYLRGDLVWEKKEVQLSSKDTWWVATVAWPSGAVTPFSGTGAGGQKIVSGYESPLFLNP